MTVINIINKAKYLKLFNCHSECATTIRRANMKNSISG